MDYILVDNVPAASMSTHSQKWLSTLKILDIFEYFTMQSYSSSLGSWPSSPSVLSSPLLSSAAAPATEAPAPAAAAAAPLLN